MDKENFAMQLVEKQLKRSEFHFYAVCVLFFFFMMLAYFMPSAAEMKQLVNNSEYINQEMNDESGAKH